MQKQTVSKILNQNYYYYYYIHVYRMVTLTNKTNTIPILIHQCVKSDLNIKNIREVERRA
jgi:hypothetical protein